MVPLGFVTGLGREDDTELGDAGQIDDAGAVETVGVINSLTLSLSL
jgi:hypothetical protein